MTDAVNSLCCEHLQVTAHAQGDTLAQVHASVQSGRFTAILGPNGAGKSSLMSILVGLRKPLAGRVVFKGRALQQWPAAVLAQHMAFMAQDTQVAFSFTSQEVVEMGRYPHRHHPKADEAHVVQCAMQATGVMHLADREVATLSGGERARVHLARALAQAWHPLPDGSARWLLLDEPTAALDLQHQHACMQLLRQRADQGFGVVAVLHDLNLALRYAHDVVVVPGGGQAVLMGRCQDVLTPQCIEQVWGVRGELLHMQDGVQQYVFGAAPAAAA
ncbi:heme ABC transporter ATP-binding protein [Comamonas sp.]|uniref:heme ABC transporter ATP-binding protein n=1 Tax=Comamonas sp. TaxID=34028 RepID=UPI0025876805|nr:heme ABC transporter ATP-binding protein [Comamonas sp.]